MRNEMIQERKSLRTALQALQLEVVDLSTVPESFSSEVYRLTLADGERAILKIPFNRGKLRRERKVLQLLDGKLPVPQILDFWEGDEEIPGAFLLSELPGEPIPEGRPSEQLAYDLGELLGRIHSIPVEQHGCLLEPHDPEQPVEWRGEMLDQFERFKVGCRELLTPELYQQAVDWFEERFPKLPEPEGPVLTHRDYRPGNILVVDGEITGLLDFESSRGGLADADFVKMKVFLWEPYPETKESFLAGYRSVRELPEIEVTLPFHFFINAFGGVNWCYVRNQPDGEFFYKNLAQLKEIMGVE